MKNKSEILILAILLFSLVPSLVSADMGPKPFVDIDFLYNGNKISDANFSAKMLSCTYETKYEKIISALEPYEKSGGWDDECEKIAPDYGFEKKYCHGELQHRRRIINLSSRDLCKRENSDNCEKVIVKIPDEDKECYWTPDPLAWGGDCRDSKCHFGYMPPSEFKLAVYVPSLDKVFISNEISRMNFKSNYEVILNSDGSAKISETTPLIRKDNVSSFIKALIITLIIELLVALIFVSTTELPKKILISVLVGSLITLPIVWFIFPLIKIIPLVILLSEIFAIVFEAYFIYYLNKQAITLKKSFVLSTIMNLASLIIGGFISLVLSIVFYI